MSRQDLDSADLDIGVVCHELPSIDPTVLDQQAVVQIDGSGLDGTEDILDVGGGRVPILSVFGGK